MASSTMVSCKNVTKVLKPSCALNFISVCMNVFMIALHFNNMVRSYVNSIGGRLKFANLILFLLPL